MVDKLELQDMVAYAVSGIRHTIATFGPRAPGSEGERRAQGSIQAELSKYADETTSEEFSVSPKAFMGFMPLAGSLLAMATLLYWWLPAASLAFTGSALLIALLQFLLCKRFLDPLFPHSTSINVTGVLRAGNERRRRVFICGHTDAAFQWRFHSRGGPKLLTTVALGATIAAALKLGSDVFCIIACGAAISPEGPCRLVGWIQLLGLPFFIAMIFFSDFKTVSPGANDNLTAVWTGMALMKHLHERARFAHTEVCMLATGCEEAGLRGAKEYARKHAAAIRGTDTIFLVLEVLREREHLAVYHRDLNATVKNDAFVSALLKEAGRRCGMELPYGSIFPGASDAAAFSQAGLAASTLAAMDPTPARYYHTVLDDKDNLSAECLEVSMQIVLEAIRLYDAGTEISGP